MATYPVTFVSPEGAAFDNPGQRPGSTGEVRVEVADDEYLLDAANAAGLGLPYMCLQGWCTTCAGRVLEGKVDQTEARRLYPQDEAAGFVLLCSAFPRSPLRSAPTRRRRCAPTAAPSACRPLTVDP